MKNVKELKCGDVSGLMDCPFVADGETAEEVKEKIMEHGREAHSELMQNMTPEEIEQMEEKAEKLLKNQ